MSGGDGKSKTKGAERQAAGARPASKADEGASFADLIGDAERLAPSKTRAPIKTAAAVSAAREERAGAAGAGRGASFRWPDPEDRGRAAAEGVSDTELFALGRGEPEPEERVDLHGARRDAAGRLVAKRIESARARGLRCVLIVHGHGKRSDSGEAILKKALPDWLTRGPAAQAVLAFAPAPRKLGGEGATMVLLRRQGRAR